MTGNDRHAAELRAHIDVYVRGPHAWLQELTGLLLDDVEHGRLTAAQPIDLNGRDVIVVDVERHRFNRTPIIRQADGPGTVDGGHCAGR
jgi:hypothetical protein